VGRVSLRGKTLFITGASRGIGKAIALRAARDGANIAVVGKTEAPHPKLPGTVPDTVREIEAAGGRGLGCIADVRSEEQVAAAVASTVRTFGGIDILINNASAISLTGTEATELKRFDLMFSVNTRGSFLCAKLCIPHLRVAQNPHILVLSPPLNLEPRWFAPHLAYSISKYGMSLCVLGLAEELRGDGIAVNALWPRTAIQTAAVQNLLGGESSMARARKPEIVADAAHVVLCKNSRELSGQFLLDEQVLRGAGITDLSGYADVSDAELMPDFFV
jgi:citronellol/citronellal dehydrogenase